VKSAFFVQIRGKGMNNLENKKFFLG